MFFAINVFCNSLSSKIARCCWSHIKIQTTMLMELPKVHKEDEERTALIIRDDDDDDRITPPPPSDEALVVDSPSPNNARLRCMIVALTLLNVALVAFLLHGNDHTGQTFRLGLAQHMSPKSPNPSDAQSAPTSNPVAGAPPSVPAAVKDFPTLSPTSSPSASPAVGGAVVTTASTDATLTSSSSTTIATSTTSNSTIGDSSLLNNNEKTLYIHALPAMTTDLVYNPSGFSKEATDFTESPHTLNEDLGELWLHQGFERSVGARISNPIDADVFIAPAYFYLSGSVGTFGNMTHLQRVDRMIAQLDNGIDSIVAMKREKYKDSLPANIVDWKMTHIVMSPATNTPMANSLAISKLVQFLQRKVGKANVYSISFERNEGWAGSNSLENIIVAPYVVKPSLPHDEFAAAAFTSNTRKDDFVFYLANSRKNAVEWGGCNRSMVLPLKDEPNMKVGLDESVPQAEFQRYMLESDYCLITCGDTPTSRRLTDSMLFGCIPIFIGTRLFGECVPPCKKGWGWSLTGGLAHLPFEDQIPWHEFPVVDEATFTDAPKKVLEGVFTNYTSQKKEMLRGIMQKVQFSFVYGWGSPIEPINFGNATTALWKTIVSVVG